LSLAEQRSEQEILADLTTTGADVLRLRLQPPGSKDGTLLLEDAAKATNHLRDLLLAASCAEILRRPWFHTRKPLRAEEFVRQLRLGQTERGSFVLSVQSRVAPALTEPEPGKLLEIEEPFERRAMTRLALALHAVQEASEEAASTGKLGVFRQAVSAGVSANLCSALAGLSPNEPGRSPLSFEFTWSRTRPQLGTIPAKVAILADALPIIDEAGRLLRETSVWEDIEVRGVVIRLDRPENSSVGTVMLFGVIEDKDRKVQIQLQGSDYDHAIQAHKDGSQVVCKGNLRKEGRSFVLQQPHEFEVIGDD
jgi:hypothetical protein